MCAKLRQYSEQGVRGELRPGHASGSTASVILMIGRRNSIQKFDGAISLAYCCVWLRWNLATRRPSRFWIRFDPLPFAVRGGI